MSVAARVWLAGTASLAVATGLALLTSPSLLGAPDDVPWIRPAVALAAIALLAASWVAALAPDRATLGTLVPLLAIAWIAPVLIGWHDGPLIVRVIARAAQPLIAPLLLHIALLGPLPRVSRAWRIALWSVYGATVVVSVVVLLTRNAFYDVRCAADCGIPPVLLGAPIWMTAAGALTGTSVVAAALGVGIAHAFSAPRNALRSPTALSALVSLAITAAGAASSFVLAVSDDRRGLVATVLLAALALSLTALAATIVVAAARSAQRARRVGELADELRHMPYQGSAEAALARLTRDDSVRVRFPLGPDGRLIDSHGRPAAITQAPHRRQLEIRRGGHPIAIVDVDGSRADMRGLVDPLGSAATIAIDNERLHAEILAHLAELRESRERIVDAADAARLHTERDLHDGAQSSLVGLLYSLTAIARTRPAGWSEADAALLDDAASTVRELVTRLREVAHGVYPADLASTGLEEAIRTLVAREGTTVDLSIELAPRPPARVERLVYAVVARLLTAGAGPAWFEIIRTGDRLRVRCGGRGVPADVRDRIAVMGATLTFEGDVVVMEVPCV